MHGRGTVAMFKVIEGHGQTRARLQLMPAPVAGLLAAIVTAFLLMFLVFPDSKNPPVLALIIAAAVCAVAFVLTTLFASRLARSGHWDLVIDHARKIVRLTATSRSHTKEIPL